MTQVQATGAYTTSPSTTLTADILTTPGDTLVVTGVVSGATIDKLVPVTDSAGNRYQFVTDETTGPVTVSMFYTVATTSVQWVTLATTSAATMAMSVQELDGADRLDAVIGASGLGTSPDTGPSPNSLTAPEITVGAIGFVGPGALTAYRQNFVINASYISAPAPAGAAIQSAYEYSSAVGPQEYSATFASPNAWGAIAASFYSSSAAASTAGAPAQIQPGQTLTPGHQISSSSGSFYGSRVGFELIMQTDGNLVVYAPDPSGGGYTPPGGSNTVGRYLWASNTYCSSCDTQGYYVTVQTDGNFVLYDNTCFPNVCPNGPTALWNSKTCCYNPDYLVMQNDGNLVLYCSAAGGNLCSRQGQAIWSSGSYHGADTPAFTWTGVGTCWTGAQLCRNTWSGQHQSIYFRAIDQFSSNSSWNSSWTTQVQNAVNAWNQAPGPQWYSFTPHTNDTWNYITASNGGPGNEYGVGTNYYANGQPCGGCTGVVEWTQIVLFIPTIQGGPQNIVAQTVAHESGHAMLLGHNPVTASALMYPQQNGNTGPTGYDLGTDGCQYGGFGVFCVYGW
jgi:hypothetical protein